MNERWGLIDGFADSRAFHGGVLWESIHAAEPFERIDEELAWLRSEGFLP